MIKYLLRGYYSKKIELVECERESDQSVWSKGRRSAKQSDGYQYFDTFEEAKNAWIQFTQEQVEAARRQLQDAHAQLGNAKGAKHP